MKIYRHSGTVKAARILRIRPNEQGAPYWPDLDTDTAEPMSHRAWTAAARDVLAGNTLGYLVIWPNNMDEYVTTADFEAAFTEAK